jgi:hypothetical protein
MEKLRGKITYASLVATAALFIALGGAACAATQLPKDSVGSRQLRKGAVRTSDADQDPVRGTAGVAGSRRSPGTGATSTAWEGALSNCEPSPRPARVFVLCAG